MTDALRLIRVLGLVSLLCGVLIVATHINTEGRIRANQETITRDAVRRLLPGMSRQVIYGLAPNGELSVLQHSDGAAIFAGYDPSGKLIGLVMKASERGYADIINAMYSYNPETRNITGFSVTDMRETPGLGDRIATDPKFLQNFRALDAAHRIETVRDGRKRNAWEIDAISGATVSSRAVGRMLQNSVAIMHPVVVRNLDRIRRGE